MTTLPRYSLACGLLLVLASGNGCGSDGASSGDEPGAGAGGEPSAGGSTSNAGGTSSAHAGKAGSAASAGKSAGVGGTGGASGVGGTSGAAGHAGKSNGGSGGTTSAGGAAGHAGSAGFGGTTGGTTGGNPGSGGASGQSTGAGGMPPGPPPDFGPNVLIFDPSMSNDTIQKKLDDVFGGQEKNQFGTERFAYFFKPGKYDVDVQIGFYMQALGLGRSPDDVQITGAVRSKATWFQGNATQNFWRAAENLSVVPTQDGNVDVWAVSQATWLRRMHIQGKIALSDNGWSSGGFIADTRIDDQIASGTQQQFLTRNSSLGNWNGGSWNMVFVGDEQTPGGDWPGSPFTVIDHTPRIREKPYLFLDDGGNYMVRVPGLKNDSQGTGWGANQDAGTTVSIDSFHVAHADKDDAKSLEDALSQGKNLLFTPGVYHLGATLHVTHPDTIVLGLGLATLVPDNGNASMEIGDVDGVSVGGLIFEAGPTESPNLLVVGKPDSPAGDASRPVALFDVSCRIGGAVAGTASNCLTIHRNDVITDNLWMWRADHGAGADWYTNKSKNGFVVNGKDVTAYGLFVEHFQEYQTMWNGDGGRVYFYQSEIPYDVPSQGEWSHDGENGYSSFKVGDGVTSHDAWGLGVYCVFYNDVRLENAIETPNASGVTFHHMVTEWLGVAAGSEITHIIDGQGNAVSNGNMQSKTDY